MKIWYEARKDVKQLFKGDGGVWYMKDNEWCEDHGVKIPKILNHM